LQCSITRELLRYELATKDAHPWNIFFDFTRPVFIDFGSVAFLEDVRVSRWINEFRRAFYVPLWLAARKKMVFFHWSNSEDQTGPIRNILSQTSLRRLCFTFNRLAAKASSHGFDRFLLSLIEHLESLQLNGNERALNDKEPVWDPNLIAEILRSVDATEVIDLAAHSDVYATMAADLGSSVVAMNRDWETVEYLHRRFRTSKARVLTLTVDPLWPTRQLGMGLLCPNAYDRLRCDIGLALNVVQDLVSRGASLNLIADIISQFVRRYALVEFDARDNQQSSRTSRARSVESPVSEKPFLNAFQSRFRLCKTWEHPDITSKLYLFARLGHSANAPRVQNAGSCARVIGASRTPGALGRF